jgi:hypothetical protein
MTDAGDERRMQVAIAIEEVEASLRELQWVETHLRDAHSRAIALGTDSDNREVEHAITSAANAYVKIREVRNQTDQMMIHLRNYREQIS